MLILIGLLLVLVITALTGYFVAQEFGYVAVDRGRIVREALAQVLSELERDGAEASLVKRLTTR